METSNKRDGIHVLFKKLRIENVKAEKDSADKVCIIAWYTMHE